MSHAFAAWTIDRTISSELEAGHRLLAELLAKLQVENWSARDIFGTGIGIRPKNERLHPGIAHRRERLADLRFTVWGYASRRHY